MCKGDASKYAQGHLRKAWSFYYNNIALKNLDISCHQRVLTPAPAVTPRGFWQSSVTATVIIRLGKVKITMGITIITATTESHDAERD